MRYEETPFIDLRKRLANVWKSALRRAPDATSTDHRDAHGWGGRARIPARPFVAPLKGQRDEPGLSVAGLDRQTGRASAGLHPLQSARGQPEDDDT